MNSSVQRIGVISDTHGKLLPSVFEAFRGVDLILHAGDVGNDVILAELHVIAPVKAVSGNVDGWELRQTCPEARVVELPGHKILLVHGHRYPDAKTRFARLAEAARENGAGAVIHGHSHRPCDETVGGVRVLNPGSATQPRGLPHPTVALLTVEGGNLRWDLVEVEG